MTGSQPEGRRRLRPIDLARAAFLVAAIAFGWWGLRSHGPEILAALGRTSPARVLAATLLVLGGLTITGRVWHRILSGYGHPVPRRQAARIFFVGQLGKYIPGSVWSLGAQADMARVYRVPARTTVAVGLLFLWVHVLSAVPVAAVWAQLEVVRVPSWPWLVALAVVGGLAALTPPVLSWVGGRLAGASEALRLGWSDSGWLVCSMALVWLLYGASATLVAPPPDPSPVTAWDAAVATPAESSGGIAGLVLPITGAFALAYVVGVLVVVAPAGVGAREGVLVALLAEPLGLPAAVATALLIRLVHTVADFAIAALAWAVARPTRSPGTPAPRPHGPP